MDTYKYKFIVYTYLFVYYFEHSTMRLLMTQLRMMKTVWAIQNNVEEVSERNIYIHIGICIYISKSSMIVNDQNSEDTSKLKQ